jgi:hypothetical protein
MVQLLTTLGETKLGQCEIMKSMRLGSGGSINRVVGDCATKVYEAVSQRGQLVLPASLAIAGDRVRLWGGMPAAGNVPKYRSKA